MAMTVPDIVPTASPTTQGAPEVNLPVPVDAFGGAVGHAIEGLGNQIEQSSDRIWQRAVDLQNINNETSARDADAKYMVESGKLHAEFITQKGVNAGPEALAQHIQQLQDLRTSIRQGLNPAAARMYDGSSLGFMGRNIFNAAGHSGEETQRSAIEAAQSRKQITKNSVEANPDDDIAIQRAGRSIQGDNASIGKLLGWEPDTLKANNDKDLSDVIASRISGINKTNAPRAQALFDEAVKAKAIDERVVEPLQASITTQMRLQGSRTLSDKILGDRRQGDEENMPLQTYIDRAMEKVDKDPMYQRAAKDDPLFKDFVRDRLAQDYNRQRAVETDQDNMNVRTIGQALVKANQEGIRPSTVEQLMAVDPKVGPAWDEISRNPALQSRFMKTLEHNATQPHISPTAENLSITHGAIDRANTGTTEEQAEFMAHDWANETKLTYEQRGRLMDIQNQKNKAAYQSAAADPRVSRALSLLDNQLYSAGISKNTNPDDYHAMRGALQAELMQYQQDNKKLPNTNEIIEMGKNLIKSQPVKGGGFLGLWDANMPVYKIPITDEERKPIIADYTRRFGQPPSDTMVERIIQAQHYNKFYGQKAKAPE